MTAGVAWDTSGSLAYAYWRAACILSFSHAAGLSWPPPGRAQRERAAGHWGCNPGIAWIVGHLAETSEQDFLVVVGTGHAGSFLFAHEVLQGYLKPSEVSDLTRGYGQPRGTPTERVGVTNVPYVGGELGPALGVGQGLAAAVRGNRVVTVVGDGECETPVALAALVHHDLLLRREDGGVWLPAVNVNGARMGSPARFSADRLARLLRALGYEVVSSGTNAAEASGVARRAWRLAELRVPVVWLSCTDKGWPAPELLNGRPFRGHLAHKLAELDLTDSALVDELQDWLGALGTPPVFDEAGEPHDVVLRLALRARLDLPTRAETAPTGHALPAPGISPVSPMEAVDLVLTARGVRIFSPDEASSNRLTRALEAGLVTEVLAEELCSAWAWGFTEAGVASAVVSYEAFAPLMATQISQYLKVLASRQPAGRPPYLVVLTSLGWANSPTHQNTDFVGGLLARTAGPVRLVFPLGAASAATRLDELASNRDVVAALVCSKQALPDLPDPGGAAVGIALRSARARQATVIAVGDVVVAEAVAAMRLAARHGVEIDVIALVDLTGLDATQDALRAACAGPVPAVCASWIAPHHLAAVYRLVRPEPTTHLGYLERWGATPKETLRANGLTKLSFLRHLADAGCAMPAELFREADLEVDAFHLNTDLDVRAL